MFKLCKIETNSKLIFKLLLDSASIKLFCQSAFKVSENSVSIYGLNCEPVKDKIQSPHFYYHCLILYLNLEYLIFVTSYLIVTERKLRTFPMFLNLRMSTSENNSNKRTLLLRNLSNLKSNALWMKSKRLMDKNQWVICFVS